MNAAEQKESHSEEQAKAQLESIKLMVARLEHAGECKNEEEDCDDCEGTGDVLNAQGDNEDCPRCKGTGQVSACELSDEDIISGLGYSYQGKPATDDQREEYHNEEAARTAIEEDALEVSVRGDWHTPGDSEASAPTEYLILLCTGGPACRIVGDLDSHSQPTSARLQHQDWFTPWQEYITTGDDHEALLGYACCFYFGE